ncbi:PTS systemcellobiose-specific IIB component [Vibrio maritimus]|uniref:PTS systemcellobiose-specific IIB component n=1 Tax=Vibrio maritimus TaxID=990268 RepID=A0A090SW10_9VIBR|nr:PTS systemcellobiose-specific IIB component [Vibrio maritimus]
MVVSKMRQSASAKGIEAHIEAVGLEEFEGNLPNFDCVLLGPQIKYKLNDFKEKADAVNKPIAVMNQMDYGMMKGEKILNDAIAMLNR